jgi:hypothetical protein
VNKKATRHGATITIVKRLPLMKVQQVIVVKKIVSIIRTTRKRGTRIRKLS